MRWPGQAGTNAGSHTRPSAPLECRHSVGPAALWLQWQQEGPRHGSLPGSLGAEPSAEQPAAAREREEAEQHSLHVVMDSCCQSDLSRAALQFRVRVDGEGEVGGEGGQEWRGQLHGSREAGQPN